MVWQVFAPPGMKAIKEGDRRAVHELSASTMIQELYQLLIMFLADRDLVASFEKDMPVTSSKEDPLFILREAVIEPTATKLLIETAVKNRWRADAHIDILRAQKYPEPIEGPWSVTVGRWLKNERSDSWQCLNLREACNKIIHADEIEGLFESSEDALSVLNGLVQTRGKNNDLKWKSEINIKNYVRASLFNIYGGIDFPRGWMCR
jgi:hypothetical protein